VLLLQLQVLLVQGVDTVNHDLDELDLGVSQPVLVGDIVCATIEATGLSPGATGLHSQLFTPRLQSIESLLGVAGEVNHDRCPHASAQVGGAGVDVAVLLGESKLLASLSLDRVSHSLDTTGKTGKDSLDVSTLLHGDDPRLILLIDPQQEGLGLIVEDATALGPVTLHTSSGEVTVSRDEEEVVIHQLLANLLIHPSERVVGASKVSGQLAQGVLHQFLNLNALVLGDSRGQTVAINGATHPDTGGVDRDSFIDVATDLANIHVGGVLGSGGDAMVLLDDGIKHLSEVLVGVPVSSVDSAVLVVKFDCTGDGLGQGEATGLGLDVLDLVPSLLGHMLGDKGVGGLDDGEFSGHI